MEELQKRIEEERRALNEVREYDKIKTEFFANISHELRTPINVIFSALQVLDLHITGCPYGSSDANANKYSKVMKQNCYRLLRLVNNLIDITKIDYGYFEINRKNYNIVSLVEEITLSVAGYAEGKGLELIFDTDVEEKIIACDPDKIERIIMNLLSNAVKFTGKGGNIMVALNDLGDSIRISVKDDGRGIPKEKVGAIFGRFIQVDKSLARDHEGSGIGLSLVKSLVEMHGGTISVDSKIGTGTEFTIVLPCDIIEETEVEQIDQLLPGYIERINIEFSDIYN